MLGLLFFISALFAQKIKLGSEILDVEIANTHDLRAKGLMWRTELNENEGMLFVYQRPSRLVFWMKNTLIPLSVGFFNEKHELLEVLDMDPPVNQNYVKYRSRLPSLYALEVPQGWFEKKGIFKGAKFSFIDEQEIHE